MNIRSFMPFTAAAFLALTSSDASSSAYSPYVEGPREATLSVPTPGFFTVKAWHDIDEIPFDTTTLNIPSFGLGLIEEVMKKIQHLPLLTQMLIPSHADISPSEARTFASHPTLREVYGQYEDIYNGRFSIRLIWMRGASKIPTIGDRGIWAPEEPAHATAISEEYVSSSISSLTKYLFKSSPEDPQFLDICTELRAVKTTELTEETRSILNALHLKIPRRQLMSNQIEGMDALGAEYGKKNLEARLWVSADKLEEDGKVSFLWAVKRYLTMFIDLKGGATYQRSQEDDLRWYLIHDENPGETSINDTSIPMVAGYWLAKEIAGS